MGATKIEWCDTTWNPVTGCSPCAAGCVNCWARRMATRLAGRNGYDAKEPFQVTFHEDRLGEPIHWKKPRKIAVSLMGDLFHGTVCDSWIERVFGVMEKCDRHQWILLTKRPARMARHLRAWAPVKRPWWVGYSASTQLDLARGLLEIRQAWSQFRFLSLEPLLEEIHLGDDFWKPDKRLEWVIVGCESGPGRRPCPIEAVESVVAQCRAAGVPCYCKQIEIGGKVCHDVDQFPPHLRLREFPCQK